MLPRGITTPPAVFSCHPQHLIKFIQNQNFEAIAEAGIDNKNQFTFCLKKTLLLELPLQMKR
jgi:hypothetical protein